ncbi:MAG TPA: 4Fe-4S binding protein [Planctomycetota bacterium]|jgi:hypothetical protein
MAKLKPFLLRLRVGCSFVSSFLLNISGLRRFAFFAAILPTFAQKTLCNPGMNCHGCPWAIGACPIGVMAYGSAIHALPLYAISFMLVLTAAIGRLTCAFLCPFGLLQDLLYKIPFFKVKLPPVLRYGKYVALVLLVFLLPFLLGFEQSGYLRVEKPQINKAVAKDDEQTADVVGKLDVVVKVANLGTKPVERPHIDLKYVDETKKELATFGNDFPGATIPPGETLTLPAVRVPNRLDEGVLIATSPQSEVTQTSPFQLYYCKLCPVGTLEATVPSMVSAPSTGMYTLSSGRALRLGILAFFLMLMLMISRPFCRTFCPAGAFYALFSRLALCRLELTPGQCNGCGACNRVCPVDLDVSKQIGSAECIACGDCIKVCPKSGLRRKFGL